MTVYVDDMRRRWKPPHMPHRTWIMSHMFADTVEELNTFAKRLGLSLGDLQTSWPHYDVTDTVRKQALALGATPIRYRELPAKLRELGFR